MQPFVSIILPVRNEERYIDACLRSIAAQDYPADRMEVLIVDGLSEDDTVAQINNCKLQISNKGPDSSASRAEKQTQNDGVGIRVLENPKKVVGAGLNIGFKAARGDIIMRMDAHAQYGRDYVSQCLAALEKSGAANVGGPALALPGGEGPLAQAIALAHYSPFGLGGGQFREPGAEGFVETVWPGCFRREVFDKVGYIDERRTRTEDLEFNTRLRAAGYRIYLSPLIRAYYYCRTTLGGTWRQRWADGWEITRFLPDNPKAPRLRHFVPLLFVTTILFLILASLISLKSSIGSTGATGLTGLIGSISLNLFNFFDRTNSFNRLALLLLAVELGAYFGAMLFFVGQAGRSVQRTADRGQAGWRQLKVKSIKFKVDTSIQGIGDSEKADSGQGTGDSRGTKYQIPNTEYRIHSLLLLPLVFMTLHFSYGLGSIWGLATLPFVSLKFKAES